MLENNLNEVPEKVDPEVTDEPVADPIPPDVEPEADTPEDPEPKSEIPDVREASPEEVEEVMSGKKYPIFVGLRLKDKDEQRGFTGVIQSPGAIADMWATALYDSSGTLKGVYTMHQNAIWVMYEPADKTQRPPEGTETDREKAVDTSEDGG